MAEEIDLEVLLAVPFGQALEMVENTLMTEGFSVVTRFDVQRTMKDRLHIPFRPYLILGTCNERIAELIQENDPCISLMMPCNISIELDANEITHVRVADPAQLVSCKCGEDTAIQEIADDTSQRLLRVLHKLQNLELPSDNDGKSWHRLNADHQE